MSPEEMKTLSLYFLCNVPDTSVNISAVELKKMIGMLDILRLTTCMYLRIYELNWVVSDKIMIKTAFSINGLTFL